MSATLLDACRFAAMKFREYELHHRVKLTKEGQRKAEENARHAKRIEDAIAQAIKEGL